MFLYSYPLSNQYYWCYHFFSFNIKPFSCIVEFSTWFIQTALPQLSQIHNLNSFVIQNKTANIDFHWCSIPIPPGHKRPYGNPGLCPDSTISHVNHVSAMCLHSNIPKLNVLQTHLLVKMEKTDQRHNTCGLEKQRMKSADYPLLSSNSQKQIWSDLVHTFY